MHESKNHDSFRDEIGSVSQTEILKLKQKQTKKEVSNKQHKDTTDTRISSE